MSLSTKVRRIRIDVNHWQNVCSWFIFLLEALRRHQNQHQIFHLKTLWVDTNVDTFFLSQNYAILSRCLWELPLLRAHNDNTSPSKCASTLQGQSPIKYLACKIQRSMALKMAKDRQWHPFGAHRYGMWDSIKLCSGGLWNLLIYVYIRNDRDLQIS